MTATLGRWTGGDTGPAVRPPARGADTLAACGKEGATHTSAQPGAFRPRADSEAQAQEPPVQLEGDRKRVCGRRDVGQEGSRPVQTE